MRRVIWKDLSDAERDAALFRPASVTPHSVTNAVSDIFADIERDGAKALRALTQKFDEYDPDPLFVPAKEIASAGDAIGKELRAAIDVAHANIVKFHTAQGLRAFSVETMPGLNCARRIVPLQTVGLYIPGGTAPLLSTTLMLGVPSSIAGNPHRVMCTPANKEGRVHPAILYAAYKCGITEVARVGGAQAIAALTFGNAGLPMADKIFGPGNLYVTEAKVQSARRAGGPAIDMPAGPSEVLVIAHKSTPPAFAAADLLAQAEHDTASHVVLIAEDDAVLDAIMDEAKRQLASLPRAKIAGKALEGSVAIRASSIEEAIVISNRYAPEHLIFCFDGADRYLDAVTNAGSIFCGLNTPESLGDYASGTNHILPTSAYARNYSGIGVEMFQKSITVQSASAAALRTIGPHVVAMAQAETLDAHARAVQIRLEEVA